MDKWKELLNINKIRIIDHTEISQFNDFKYSALTSFAIDDALAISVGEKKSPVTIRLWVHDNTVVLGIPDSRMPHIEDGIQFLKRNKQTIVIRNSGGLAVALDSGVLNLSFIMPNDNNISIHTGYDIMKSFIQDLLKDYTSAIKAYEIVGSFCPGDYDLSINGIKFAGISQRRVKNGISVQIYIDIEGKNDAQALLIKEFYKQSLKNKQTKMIYPNVNPKVMGSLSTILNQDITVKEIIKKLNNLLTENQIDQNNQPLSSEENTTFNKRLLQMHKRNEVIHDPIE